MQKTETVKVENFQLESDESTSEQKTEHLQVKEV